MSRLANHSTIRLWLATILKAAVATDKRRHRRGHINSEPRPLLLACGWIDRSARHLTSIGRAQRTRHIRVQVLVHALCSLRNLRVVCLMALVHLLARARSIILARVHLSAIHNEAVVIARVGNVSRLLLGQLLP